ncbi:MAG: hypothetical protein ACE5OY_02145 [Candidatus Bathyarchaeia archaeon]
MVALNTIPFAINSKERRAHFTREMEVAAIFSLAAIGREKGGGIIGKRAPERISFVAPCLYPIWVCGRANKIAFFDGLDLASARVTPKGVKDLDKLIEDAESSLKKLDMFRIMLAELKEKDWKELIEEREVEIAGLIQAEDVSALCEMLTQIEPMRGREARRYIMLKSSLDEDAVKERFQKLLDAKNEVEMESAKLRKLANSLSKGVKLSEKLMRREIAEIEERYGEKLREAQKLVDKRVGAMREKMGEEIERAAKRFAYRKRRIYKACKLSEATIHHLEESIEAYEKEASLAASRGAEEERRGWIEKKTTAEKVIADERRKLSELYPQLAELEEEEKEKSGTIRRRYDIDMEDARKGLNAIVAEKEAEIGIRQDRIGEIVHLASEVIKKIEDLINGLAGETRGFDALCAIAPAAMRTKALKVPFYIVKYENEADRYSVYFPVEVSDKSLSAKGVAEVSEQMRTLLRDRFPWTRGIIENLQEAIRGDAEFRNTLSEEGAKVNLLATEESRDAIMSGLVELKNEGWLSDKDLRDLEADLRHVGKV